ncbi:hypothetical protein ES708_27090 [subsurface metagenome]
MPHLPNILPISSPLSFLAINNILSWVSESIISLGVIPFSLRGTKERSNSIPQFPLLAISQVELTNPAAPKSCIPKISPSFTSSKQDSINFFSKRGLPWGIEGCSISFASPFNSREAKLALPTPSLPVFSPAKITILSDPSATATTMSSFFTKPTHIAFTKGLP